MMPALQIIDLIQTEEGARFAPSGRMASAIIEITSAKGECLQQDLLCEGFTAEEIRTHWHMAHSLASTETKLMAGQLLSHSMRDKNHV